jgi:hypothetical protein
MNLIPLIVLITRLNDGIISVDIPPAEGFDRAELQTRFVHADWSWYADWRGIPPALRGPFQIVVDTKTLPPNAVFQVEYLP